MRKITKALKFTIVFSLILSSFLACDKDFTTIESDVLGEDNANFTTNSEKLQTVAYNKKLDSLQINGLASNLFGVFDDPAYGRTTASIVAQVEPSSYNPNFAEKTSIDSVILTIPYYSRAITDSTYTISDSLYGEDAIKLLIFRNNYFLRDFDPNATLGQPQNYFSKADGSVSMTDNFALNGTSVINFDTHKGDLIYSDNNFVPSSDRIRLDTYADGTLESTQYTAPMLRRKLDTLFWRTTIIDKEGDAVLSNASNFKDYFRGLYIKAEAITDKGNMVLLNMGSADAKITIYYTGETSNGDPVKSTYTLNFEGNVLNTFSNDYNLVTLQNGDKTLGDEKLYLKGAEGSMAVIDLFGSEEGLNTFKDTYRKKDTEGNYIEDRNGNFLLKRLINDAQLIVYEDETMATGGDSDYHEYDRLYAYDIENDTTLVDYRADPIVNQQNPYYSKVIHLGQREVVDGTGRYKIHLTQHLNNILIRDSTNTKIGLVLSSNVNYTNNAKILNSGDAVKAVPAASIITPRGTILYGTNSSVPEDRKMTLEIFFTEQK